MAMTVQSIRHNKKTKCVKMSKRKQNKRLDRGIDQTIKEWTHREREIFKQKYLKHPKNFSVIASFLDGKSSLDCVKFYYLTKKKEHYKQLIRKRQHLQGLGRPWKLKELDIDVQVSLKRTIATTEVIWKKLNRRSDDSRIKGYHWKELLNKMEPKRGRGRPRNIKLGVDRTLKLQKGPGKSPKKSLKNISYSTKIRSHHDTIRIREEKSRTLNLACPILNPHFEDWFHFASTYAIRRLMEQLQLSIRQSGSSTTLVQGVSQITHVASVRLERISNEYIKGMDSCDTVEEVLQCELDTKDRLFNSENSMLNIDENSCSSERTVILENFDDREDVESLARTIIISDSESETEGVEDAPKEISGLHPKEDKICRSSCDTLNFSNKKAEVTRNRIPSGNVYNNSKKADDSIENKPSSEFRNVNKNNNKIKKSTKRLFKRVARIQRKFYDLFGSASPNSSPDFLKGRVSPEVPMSDDETSYVIQKAHISIQSDKPNDNNNYSSRRISPFNQTSVAISIDEDGILKISDLTQTPYSDIVKTDRPELYKKQKKKIYFPKSRLLPDVPISDYEITSSDNPLIKTLKRKRSDKGTKKLFTSQNKLKRRHSVFISGNEKRDINPRRMSHSVLDTAPWKVKNSICDMNDNVVSHRTGISDIDSDSLSRNSLICSIDVESLDMGLLLKRLNSLNSRKNREDPLTKEENSDVSSTNQEIGLIIEKRLDITNETEDPSKIRTAPDLKVLTNIGVVESHEEISVMTMKLNDEEESSSNGNTIVSLRNDEITTEEVVTVENINADQSTIASVVGFDEPIYDNLITGLNILAESSSVIQEIVRQNDSEEKENVDHNMEKHYKISNSVIQEAVIETPKSLHKNTGYQLKKYTALRGVRKHPGKFHSLMKRKLSLKKAPKVNPTPLVKSKNGCDMPCIDDSEMNYTTEACSTNFISSHLPTNDEQDFIVPANESKQKTMQPSNYALPTLVNTPTQNIQLIFRNEVLVSLDPKTLLSSENVESEAECSKILPATSCNLGTPEVTTLLNDTLPGNVLLNVTPEIGILNKEQPRTSLSHNLDVAINVSSNVDSTSVIPKIQLVSPSQSSKSHATEFLKNTLKSEDKILNIQQPESLLASNVVTIENIEISSDIIFSDDETQADEIPSMISQTQSPKKITKPAIKPTGPAKKLTGPAKKPTIGSIKVHDEAYLRGTGPIFSQTEDIESLAQKIVIIMRDTQFYRVKFLQAERLCVALQEKQKKICHDEFEKAIASLEHECVQQLLGAKMLTLSEDEHYWRVVREVAEAFITKTNFFPSFPTTLFQKVVTDLCNIRNLSLRLIGSQDIPHNGALVKPPAYSTVMTQPANVQPPNTYMSTVMPHNSTEPLTNTDVTHSANNSILVNILGKTPEILSTTQSLRGTPPSYTEKEGTANPLLAHTYNSNNQNNMYLQQEQEYAQPTSAKTHQNIQTLPMDIHIAPPTRPHINNLQQHSYMQQHPTIATSMQVPNRELSQQCSRKNEQESFTPIASGPHSPAKKRQRKNKNTKKSKLVTATMCPVPTTVEIFQSQYSQEMLNSTQGNNVTPQTASSQNNVARQRKNVSNRFPTSQRNQQFSVDPMTTGNSDNVSAQLFTHNDSSEQNIKTQDKNSMSVQSNHVDQYHMYGPGNVQCEGRNSGSDNIEQQIVFEQNAYMNIKKTVTQKFNQLAESRRDLYYPTIDSSTQQRNKKQNMAISRQQTGNNEIPSSMSTPQGEVSPRMPTIATDQGQIRYATQPHFNDNNNVVQQGGFSPNNHNMNMQSVFNPNYYGVGEQQERFSPNNHTASVQQALTPNNNIVGAQQLVNQNNYAAEVFPNNRTDGVQQSGFNPNNPTVSTQQGASSPSNSNGSTQRGFLVPNLHTAGAQYGGFSPNNHNGSIKQSVKRPNNHTVRAPFLSKPGGFSPNYHNGIIQHGVTRPNNFTASLQQGPSSPSNRNGSTQLGFSVPNNHIAGTQHGGFSPNNHIGSMQQSFKRTNNQTVSAPTLPKPGAISPNYHNSIMQQGVIMPNSTVCDQQEGFRPNNHIGTIHQSINPYNHTLVAQQALSSPNQFFNPNTCQVNVNQGVMNQNPYNVSVQPTNCPSEHTNTSVQLDELLRYHNAQISGQLAIQRMNVQSDSTLQQAVGTLHQARPAMVKPGLPEPSARLTNQNVLDHTQRLQVTIQDGMVQNNNVAAKIISDSSERSSRDSGFMSPSCL